MSVNTSHRQLSRREAIRLILSATAVASTLNLRGFAAELQAPGIGWDPDLLKKEIPWPRLLTDAEKRLVTAMADLIIPEDEFGPAASAVGVTDFIDEWVSAPYPQQRCEGKIIREGLTWLDAEPQRRLTKGFPEATPEQQTALLDDILSEGSNARRLGYDFFRLFRDRVAGGYYSTPEGWKAIGYVGNVPLPHFPGAPPEALAHLGLTS